LIGVTKASAYSGTAMRLCDILTPERIRVDGDGAQIHDKEAAIRVLSELLSSAVGVEQQTLDRLLMERERLQSTGIGDGVAIPHTSVDTAPGQAAALVLCPRGVPFDAIDGADVNIIFGVVGPKRATGEHLKTLARISRLLRDPETRSALIHSPDALAAWRLIEARDAGGR
jgi:nitrogen PTS system EIIA component